MREIAKVNLDNEMDLILAHKRSMKLAELAGLSLAAQTSFATAVSEVARTSIEDKKRTYLILSVDTDNRQKFVVAGLKKSTTDTGQNTGLEYAKRLVDKFNITTKGEDTVVELYYAIPANFKLDISRLDEWRSLFRNEPPVSPYEELKQKNEQLQDLSERIQQSESNYKTLTNALPLMIFTIDTSGQIIFANQWLTTFTGRSKEQLNQSEWKDIIHEEDYTSFLLLLKDKYVRSATAIKSQCRVLSERENKFIWHQVSLTPYTDGKDELQYWIGFLADIHAQKTFEETLRDNIELKKTQDELKSNQVKMEEFIRELNRSNQELQQYAFVASHDLQEPVRKLLFYSDYIRTKYGSKMEAKGREYLDTMHSSADRMRNLIQDLLIFSQINSKEFKFKTVNLNKIVSQAIQDFEIIISDKKAKIDVGNLPEIQGDERMMRQLVENLIGNALKYSKKDEEPVIKIRSEIHKNSVELAFSDNGIGFDETYGPQLFVLFKRLHSKTAYEGTGLGLAICKKVVDIHKGKIWATSEDGKGSTFFVSLPLSRN